MPYSVNIIRLLEKVEPSTREVLLAVLEEIERQREVTELPKRNLMSLRKLLKTWGRPLKNWLRLRKKLKLS
ncbi:hypothetical protein HS1_001104 [Candidatus Desulfofervidus auxilii]|uniref:Uncharacterized protein n=1 Tax=Desulfofervidus auxilii TaxID=1621989 RepID=A0A7U4TI71_DESA2|nr:hypothetical protein HS1_001104 [Candidatus Desulfofervidus auxilii]CAD7775239.1 hypothetical protein BLFGPEAP_01274 [Candidatus Methanoperedenaceae archaeon GB50]